MLHLPIENRIESAVDGASYSLKVWGQRLFVIASTDREWEHVSVSHKKRVPTWHEMHYIKRFFFDDEDVVVQFHPSKSAYVNDHPYCLHLWRKRDNSIELPPVECV